MLEATMFKRIGKTSIVLCDPIQGRNQYYVGAVGGRMFGSAYFVNKVNAIVYYNKLVAKAEALSVIPSTKGEKL